MKSDINGCSTCPAGRENYEFYTQKIMGKRTKLVQYDYRHTDGELFSCVAKSLDDARSRRDAWLDKKD